MSEGGGRVSTSVQQRRVRGHIYKHTTSASPAHPGRAQVSPARFDALVGAKALRAAAVTPSTVAVLSRGRARVKASVSRGTEPTRCSCSSELTRFVESGVNETKMCGCNFSARERMIISVMFLFDSIHSFALVPLGRFSRDTCYLCDSGLSATSTSLT